MVFVYLGGGSGGGSSSCVSKSFSDVLEVDDVTGAAADEAGLIEGSCDVTKTSEGKTAMEARLFRAGRGGGPRPPLLNHLQYDSSKHTRLGCYS